MEVFWAVPVRAGGQGVGGSDGARRGAEALATTLGTGLLRLWRRLSGGVLRIHKMGRDKEANLVLELRRSDVLGIKPIGEF